MSINKIIVALTFISVSVCRYANADELTLDEYEGMWYHVATIYPANSNPAFTCVCSQITKNRGDNEKFIENLETISSGKRFESQGRGQIVNSELEFSYPSVGIDKAVYTVTKYKGGEELILHNKLSAVHSSLLSRAPSASDEAKAAFEKKAADAGATVTYIDHENC